MENIQTKGKNFSCNNIGQRKKSDFYETPYSLTRQFLEKYFLELESKILEPSCGNGAVIRVLSEFGYKNVTGKDIKNGQDFLAETEKYDFIISNPPLQLGI